MAFNQDRKYDHWLKISPKNIEEKRAKDMGGMQGTEKPEVPIQRSEAGGSQTLKAWEAGDEGHTYGTHLSGEEGRKPHSGTHEAGKTKNPSGAKKG